MRQARGARTERWGRLEAWEDEAGEARELGLHGLASGSEAPGRWGVELVGGQHGHCVAQALGRRQRRQRHRVRLAARRRARADLDEAPAVLGALLQERLGGGGRAREAVGLGRGCRERVDGAEEVARGGERGAARGAVGGGPR